MFFRPPASCKSPQAHPLWTVASVHLYVSAGKGFQLCKELVGNAEVSGEKKLICSGVHGRLSGKKRSVNCNPLLYLGPSGMGRRL